MKSRVITALVGIPLVLACVLAVHPAPLAALLALVAGLSVPECKRLFPRWPSVLTCLLYVGPALVSLFLLHKWNPPSALLPLLCLWGGDSAAYFVGRAWGKHKLAPTISPNKTWEGAIANLIACSLVGAGFGPLLGINPLVGLGSGVACGILGQLGDLFESAQKRRVNLKDSGTLLPGHGGVLDRIDSLLFSAPVVCLIVFLTKGASSV